MNILVTAPFSEENKKMLIFSADGCNVKFDSEISDDSLLSEADVIIGDVPAGKLGLCRSLKWLQLTSAGADRYVYDNSFPRNVILTNVRGAFGDVISEYVIGSLLAMFRDFFGYKCNQQEKVWKDRRFERLLCDSRVLILGCGDIGSKTAAKLKAFGTETVGIRKNVCPTAGFDSVFGIDMLDAELGKADIIICCLPKTPLTERLIDSRRLSFVKSNAVIVNVGRGAAIDTDALTETLKENRLAGAVLDVFEQEPLPQDSLLWDMENVFITPHISGPSFGHSPGTERKIAEICVENIRNYTHNIPLVNRVSLCDGYNSGK